MFKWKFGFMLATAMLMLVGDASAEMIVAVKKNKIALRDANGDKVDVIEVTPEVRSSLEGAEVRYIQSSGLFQLRTPEGSIYLASRDIEVSNEVGESGAALCAKLKGAVVRKGASGSGGGCQ